MTNSSIETKFRQKIEQSIIELEKLLGITVTIIDKDGIFTSSSGNLLLSRFRQSHRKNPVCETEFCNRCVQHCRYEMNKKVDKLRKPFIHTCWKNLQEIVIPLVWNDIHLGSFYAGIWRIPDESIADKPLTLSDEMHREFYKLSTIEQTEYKSIIKILEIFVKGLLAELSEIKEVNDFSRGKKSQINQFLKYNAVKSISLQSLAEELCLSPSRTSHLVKELFSKSFQTMIREERIYRAKALLLTTDLPVGEIAGQVGIPDEYHFNRTFKATIGIPPGAFRKKFRSQKLFR